MAFRKLLIIHYETRDRALKYKNIGKIQYVTLNEFIATYRTEKYETPIVVGIFRRKNPRHC